MWLKHGSCAGSRQGNKECAGLIPGQRASSPGRHPRPESAVVRGMGQCASEMAAARASSVWAHLGKVGVCGPEEGAEDSNPSLGTAARPCRPAWPASLAPDLWTSQFSEEPAPEG